MKKPIKTEFEPCPSCGFENVIEVKEYRQYFMNQGLTHSKPLLEKVWHECQKCGRKLGRLKDIEHRQKKGGKS